MMDRRQACLASFTLPLVCCYCPEAKGEVPWVVSNEGVTQLLPRSSCRQLLTVKRIRSKAKDIGVDDVPGVRIAFDVQAEPKAIMAALWNGNNFAAVFPTVKSVRTLSHKGNTKELELTEKVLLMKFKYVLRLDLDMKNGSIRYQEANKKKSVMRGAITAKKSRKSRGTSRVVYTAFAEMGWYIPDSTMQAEMEKMAPDIERNTKRLVKSRS